MGKALGRLRAWLGEPIDGGSLRAFRCLFGLLLLISVARYWQRGWIRTLLVEPRLHFHYLGFEWVEPLPGWGMYAVFALLALCALGILLGRFHRASTLLFLVGFGYVELCEKAAYLNHYYLVSLITALLFFMPATLARVPRWTVWLLRAQLCIVYFFAGLAKLDSDWLLRAEPLRSWLAARSDLPVVGGLLAEPGTAYLASWLGAAFDLSAPGLLWWRRSRVVALGALSAFHLTTAVLFPTIGIFPWLMLVSATLFLPPDWPNRWLRQTDSLWPARGSEAPLRGLSRPAFALIGAYLAIQVALPLRHLLYPGSTNWTDAGFRFAWRVMLIDKVGSVRFDVVERDGPRRWSVAPSAYLTRFQEHMLGQSPDMVLELARHVARDFRERHGADVAVHADAWASLNARPSRRVIDPHADLASEPPSLEPAAWVLYGE